MFSVLFTLFGWWLAITYRKWEIKRFFSQTDDIKEEGSFEVVDGVRLHYVDQGQGEPILLLHGIAANIFCWRHVIPLLAKDHRVCAVDIKGFGRSDKPRGAFYGLKSQAELLNKFIEARKLGSVTLVGNSMGGAIAAEMALQKPELVKRLVLINSAHDPKIVLFDLRRLRAFSRFLTFFANRQVARQYIRLLYGKNLPITEDVIRAYLTPYMTDTNSHLAFMEAFDALIDPSLLPRLKKLEKPILILWGTKDRLVPLRFGQNLHNELPHSRFETHPDGGHHLQEEEPIWIVDRIRNFEREN